jgi:hypothetical protein
MAKEQPSRMAKLAGKCLRQAVRDEIRKKAMLGQYVVIMRDGKAREVPAEEALKMCKQK